MTVKTAVRVMLIFAVVFGAAMAPGVTSAQQSSQRPADPPVPVRLKIAVERMDGDKVASTTPFELIVKANVGGQTSVNHGRSVPVQQTAFLPMATGGVPTQPQVSYVYQSVGSNLNIRSMTATDTMISFELLIDISSAEAPVAGAVGPTFRKFSIQTLVTVKPGQTTVVATSTDRINSETARVSVLADIVR
jgi:hypothetical protein